MVQQPNPNPARPSRPYAKLSHTLALHPKLHVRKQSRRLLAAVRNNTMTRANQRWLGVQCGVMQWPLLAVTLGRSAPTAVATQTMVAKFDLTPPIKPQSDHYLRPYSKQ